VKETARVGLVMAAYNADPYLGMAIKAVKGQELSDFVCCIVDDGSTDRTAEIAHELTAGDDRFSVVKSDHVGVSAARNLGVRQLPATGYLCFPDADDVWHPEALSTLIEAADAFDGVGAHALGDEIDADGLPFVRGRFAQFGRDRFTAKGVGKNPVSLDVPSGFESLVQYCTVYPAGVWTLRRDCFDEVGGFDTSLRNFEDWDLQIRASRLGDFAFVDKIIVDYRKHPAQATANPLGGRPITVRFKTIRSKSNTRSQRKMAITAFRSDQFQEARSSAGMMRRQPKRAAKHAASSALHLLSCIVGPGLTPLSSDGW
jgi:glycosyltransferase involved in cell wall biosynthesis